MDSKIVCREPSDQPHNPNTEHPHFKAQPRTLLPI